MITSDRIIHVARISKAEWFVMTQPVATVAADIERLRGLIETHNAGCREECAARGEQHCYPYMSRGRRCPDCPRDGTIDDTYYNELGEPT